MRRRKYLHIALMVLIPLLLVSCNKNENDNDPRKLSFKPIAFEAPKTEKVLIDNGPIVHLLSDHELPLINMVIKVRGGSIYDPIGKEGLAALTTALLRSGGVKGILPEELDRELEFIGGKIEAKAEAGEINIGLSILTKDIDKGLKILAKIIREPAFRGDKIILEKGKFAEAIKRENDNPDNLALRELIKDIYRKGSYGRFATIDSISNIGLNDMKVFHKKYFRSDNMIIGVSGNFEKEYIVKKIVEIFKPQKGGEIAFPTINPPTSKRGVYLIDREIPQSVIRMGHLGIKKSNPDNYAVRVMNKILGGGGFTSRLVKEVRTTRGLAYSVWSLFKMGNKTDGLFVAGCETKTETTSEAIDIMLNTINKIRERAVTDEELEIAKDSIINSFAFAFKGPDEVMLNRLNVEYHGLPEDYIETFRERIDAVTKEDILRVARKYLRPDEISIVVVGNKSGFDTPLSKFGKVETIRLKD